MDKIGLKGYDIETSKEIIEELEKFQKELDSTELNLKDIQAWCGHMNYVMIELILNLRDSFSKLFNEMNRIEDNENLEEPINKDFGGFYS